MNEGMMDIKDNAEAVRRLAYDIWEEKGRPSGREHEHWAEANRRYALLHPPKSSNVVTLPRWDRSEAERGEIEALRRALYQPEAFCSELFGSPAKKVSSKRA